MFLNTGKCPICYANWADSKVCTVCGCMAMISYEQELPPVEEINVKRIEKVMQLARKRLAQHSDDPRPRYALGLSYAHLGLHAEAVDEIKQVIKRLPEKHQLRYEAAVLSIKHSLDTDWAMQQLNTILTTRPDHAQALYLRGLIHQQQHNQLAAVKDWQAAYLANNQYGPAHRKLLEFVQQVGADLPFYHLDLEAADPSIKKYVQRLQNMPDPPPPLGKTSFFILKKLAPATASRIEFIDARKNQEFGEVVNSRKKAMQILKKHPVEL